MSELNPDPAKLAAVQLSGERAGESVSGGGVQGGRSWKPWSSKEKRM